AAGAAGALGHDDVPVRIAVTCVAFCLLASGLYAVNDVHDAPEDRLHEKKRCRPVAAGELGERSALALGVTLIAFGHTMCGLVRHGVLVRAGAGEAPDELILQDRLLQLAAVAWLVLFALSVHAAS